MSARHPTAVLLVGLLLVAGCSPAPATGLASAAAGTTSSPSEPALAPGEDVAVEELIARVTAGHRDVRSYATSGAITVTLGDRKRSRKVGAVIDQSDPERVRYRSVDDDGFGLVAIGEDLYVKYIGRKAWERPSASNRRLFRQEMTALQPAVALQKVAEHVLGAVYGGTTEVSGSAAQEYRLTLAAAAFDTLCPDKRTPAGKTFEATVWLDEAGRLLKITAKGDATAEGATGAIPTALSLTVKDFDKAVSITPPK